MMPADDRLSAPQPGTAPLPELFFPGPQDFSNDNDASLLNELLDNPTLRDILSDANFLSMHPGFDQSEVNTMFANMDVNLNQNFSSHPQDFTHMNDWQFNRLVNENQIPQADAQDTSANIQVKTEDEL